MRIDGTTFRDIDRIGSGPGLLSRLDLTVSRAASERLEADLRDPVADPAALRARQEALRHLATGDALPPLPGREMDEAQRYLDSGWAAPEPSIVPPAFRDLHRSLRNPAMDEDLGRGIRAFRSLLTYVPQALPRLGSDEHGGALARTLHAAREALTRAGAERGGVTRADTILRGRERTAAAGLLEALVDLDSLRARSELLRRPGWSLPEVGADSLVGTGIFHPALDHPVGNDLDLSGRQVVFLTGPNMAGKTTYLRAIATCALLAHAGFPVPAASFRIPRLDRLITGFHPEDDLAEGVSLFLAEALRMRDVCESARAGESVLALIDEPFRGTNVLDASEAVGRILSGMRAWPRALLVASSHLGDLSSSLGDEGHVRLLSFVASDGMPPEFDFRVREGATEQRTGLRLLVELGVLADEV